MEKSDNVRQQFACVIAVNGLRGSFLQTQLMEINGLTGRHFQMLCVLENMLMNLKLSLVELR